MAMINSQNIVGTKEIADLFGISSSAVVNLQNRYTDFPPPIKRLESGPIFNLLEIQEWGGKHNRIPIRNTVPIEAGDHKSIAIVGLPRTGKSYTSSVFVAEHECFVLRRAFSGAGDDFTQCAVKIIVSPKILEPYAQFNTDNEEERKYSRIDEKRLINFVAETNDYLKQKRESGKEISPSEYIEIFVQPSQLASEIMNENKLSYLIITDTPGVSASYELVQIAEAHLVMLVLSDSGGDTARTGFKKIVEGIAPLVAAGDACFLYNLKKPCDDEEEYADMQREAEKAMQSFEADFAPLRKSVIDTSMNILHPSKSVLGIPGMKDRRINFAEETFRQELKEVINRSFKGEGLDLIVKEFHDSLKEVLSADERHTEEHICRELVNFLTNVLSDIPRLTSDITKADHFQTFKTKNHARVKTQDGYRIDNAVKIERKNLLQKLYHSFSAYTVENTPDILKQAGIKLFYRLVTEELKSDSGIGIGVHPWEDYPPVTMRAIEYILAMELENAFQKETNDPAKTYCDTMKKNGIVSKSWNCVRVDMNNLYLLSILNNSGVLSMHSSNLTELVRNRYIGGLRKIGEFKAWKLCLSAFDAKITTNYPPNTLVRLTGI
ncbi:helix-turn-helix transcriptional regulator [Brevibacillus sp. GCM10020057]|uniref:helix-turn-helix transcriptional regulator n=1 Tax=Brevibacillus sp. GCM10020057 TaxID=3317327 RepID=UPI003627E615